MNNNHSDNTDIPRSNEPQYIPYTDLSFYTRMSGRDARNSLDGKRVFLDRQGFDVTYHKLAHDKMCITIEDHYLHVPPMSYVIHPALDKTGQEIADTTFAVLNTYIAEHRLNEPRAG